MSGDGAGLTGTWRKVAGPPCAAAYPASLRFEAKGLYFGFSDPPGGFTTWDVGTWRAAGPGRLAISTANDAVIEYTFELSGDILRFADPAHCVFGYRRET